MTDWIKPSEIDELAPMSASVHRLAAIVDQADADVGDITQVVEYDQALTANILHWANSVWSGARNPIQTVREAVIRLGAGNILQLAVGHRLVKSMNQSCPAYELAENELWRHSVASALAAEYLGRFVKRPVPSVAFTAALLHDIGKLLLNRHLEPAMLTEIDRLVASEHLTYVEAEFRVLGTDHAKIGGLIARHWKFPDLLVAGIERHHEPDFAQSDVLDAVHVSNLVAKFIGVGLGSDQMNLNASTAAVDRLGLTYTGLESLCANVKAELEKAENLWEVK